jgi:hypothetical protein
MKTKTILGVCFVLFMGIGLTACSDTYASSSSDQHVCVFDGSERGGQKLKDQIPPGAKSKKIDDNDVVVKIPASNRFWMVANDRSIADPGTPRFYTGNAQGGTPVYIEGQIRFRFNLELACDWFSKHGRRNTSNGVDLGFNVRGDANQGWFRFGNENFVGTMQEIISESMYTYKYQYLHYNYPINADDAGQVPGGVTPGKSTRQVLADELGPKYTARLRERLGGDYFCGVGETTAEKPCPDMTFQIIYAGPNAGDLKSDLITDRERVEATRTQLESSRLEGELRSQQQAQLIAAEQAKAALLAEQAKTAQLQAQIDTAKCQVYAQYGLDCEGKRPPIIVNGQQVNG